MIEMPEEIKAFCTSDRYWIQKAFQELLDEANDEIAELKIKIEQLEDDFFDYRCKA